MHKNVRRIVNLLLVVMFVFSIFSTVHAAIDPTTVITGPSSSGASSLYKAGNIILGIFQALGAGVAMVALLVLAIRYMYSSPDEKAEVKKKLIPYIMGGVMVFGATSLVKIVETFTNDILKS